MPGAVCLLLVLDRLLHHNASQCKTVQAGGRGCSSSVSAAAAALCLTSVLVSHFLHLASTSLPVLLLCGLQEILADACERIAGPNVIENSSNVVAYEELRDPATGGHGGVQCGTGANAIDVSADDIAGCSLVAGVDAGWCVNV
eukprot:GHRQ01027977.1.p4 GENE.GHRQ01027977.1~~GHRQ01027977.1.p4  ORF type:complete len:143 (+),score=22.84 GHRQ01027977.1:97-525(+)